ncbi:hypothetical protein OJF2_18210 [Aquisphaera giovannonii]|uniref:Uncharacterized protein n=1 Tax=Aquisphaera giovannonii TaxID=406548 RepID=A0A5B9W093_9BACT|nr:hypothetical protein [Aquisphaera giovannonii]QEH33320.1 hypothetical protein OJF2_18210 [Aquisphaera giovannonii]
MSESESLLAEIEEIRLGVLGLFRQMSEVSRRLQEIARESPTDPEFLARGREIAILQEQQRELGQRQQQAFRRKKAVEQRLKELHVPGPWDDDPAPPDDPEAR